MSLFLREAKVTGTESTVTVGVYPILRSSCATRAVVEVTSVQPTSEKRTDRQLEESVVVGCAAAAPWSARASTVTAQRNVSSEAMAASRRLTRAYSGRHDCAAGDVLE